LTVKNVARIDRDYIDWLGESFKKLRATQMWKGWVVGGVYALDTTYNHVASTWHVHVHVILEMRELTSWDWRNKWYIEFTKAVRAEWRRITGSWVLRLQPVKPRAVNELIKYEAKAVAFIFKPDLVEEYLDAFKNVRRIQAFGSMFNVDFEDPDVPWACPCGNRAFHEWTDLGLFTVDDLVESPDGQVVLRYPDVVWDMHGGEGESLPVPDFIPLPEQAALFYKQHELVFA